MHAIARRRVGKAPPALDSADSPRTRAAKLRRQLRIWKPAALLRKLSSWTTALLLSNSSSTTIQVLMKQVWRFYQGHGGSSSSQSLDELEMQSLVGSGGSQPAAAGRRSANSHGRVNRAPTPDKGDRSSKTYRAAKKGVMHARAATKVSKPCKTAAGRLCKRQYSTMYRLVCSRKQWQHLLGTVCRQSKCHSPSQVRLPWQ